MIKKFIKNIMLVLILFLTLVLVGCETGNVEPPKDEMTVEYDELIYYSQVGKIEVASTYEYDEFYIESLNTKVIKILENTGDNLIAKAVGVGEAQINITNYHGDEINITIKVEAKGEFAPPISDFELSIKEEGPYYIGETYHVECKVIPEVYYDTYSFMKSDDYDFNTETMEIVFKRTGELSISVFAQKQSKRVILKVDVRTNPNVEMYEVLFIGNSLTYVHDIPSIIQDMIEADGVIMNYSQDTPGGSYLSDHEQMFDSLINKYYFTHVILQGQSYEPINKYDTFIEYMVKYGEAAKARGAQVIAYQSWAYDRESYNGLTRYQMTEKLKLAYDDAANLIGAKVTRSGEAFKLFEETYGRTPSLYQDMNHQSLYGAYLSACVHYSTITGRKAINNTFVLEGIEADIATQIKQIADLISFPEQ